MALTIYNTLTRRKETFTPLDPAGKRVTIYNCGPTVYGRFHIGNARNFVVMDLVRRWLERNGYEVTFVQNLTDIDDKIIKRANDEKRSTEDITREFTRAYFEDVKKLGVGDATHNPRATEYVAQMIDFMKELESKGLAYASKGSLYFRVRGFAEYGKLSGRKFDELLEGARVEVNEDKEDPLDFVLWKAAKPGEPKWPSPWGEGRPGWHTECAVMTRSILGETIDIHAGGADLMFPHHENELAQRESLSHRPFARYWMHNGFLNIDSEKMSKSVGNFKMIDEVLARHQPEAIRYFLFSGHYRHPLDFNNTALEEAAASVNRINDGLETGKRILKVADQDQRAETGDSAIQAFRLSFEEAMNDDFNTPRVNSVLHDIVTAIHDVRQKPAPDYPLLRGLVSLGEELRSFMGYAAASASGLGATSDPGILKVLQRIYTEAGKNNLDQVTASFRTKLSENEINLIADGAAELDWNKFGGPGRKGELLEVLIEARKQARKQKAYALADAVRLQLADVGIALEDHPQGTIWKEAPINK